VRVARVAHVDSWPRCRSGSVACSCLLKLLMGKKNPQPKVTLLRRCVYKIGAYHLSESDMAQRADFDNIDLYLHPSPAHLDHRTKRLAGALQLQSSQPAVSAQLKRLRELTGDPLLWRAGNGMTPTTTRCTWWGGRDPAAGSRSPVRPAAAATSFEPATSTITFRIAASDYSIRSSCPSWWRI